MAKTTTELKAKLRILLDDTDDSKWSDDMKDEAIEDALLDPAFSEYVEDASLTSAITTQDYDIPATLDVVDEIYIASGSYKYQVHNWQQYGTKIRFDVYPDYAGTMTLCGFKQLSDNIPDNKVNLALAISGYLCYENLMNRFAAGILMSDITMGEIQTGLERFREKERKERGRIKRRNNSRGYTF